MAEDKRYITMKDEQELVCGLSNGAINNDRETAIRPIYAKYLRNRERYGHNCYRKRTQAFELYNFQ